MILKTPALQSIVCGVEKPRYRVLCSKPSRHRGPLCYWLPYCNSSLGESVENRLAPLYSDLLEGSIQAPIAYFPRLLTALDKLNIFIALVPWLKVLRERAVGRGLFNVLRLAVTTALAERFNELSWVTVSDWLGKPSARLGDVWAGRVAAHCYASIQPA